MSKDAAIKEIYCPECTEPIDFDTSKESVQCDNCKAIIWYGSDKMEHYTRLDAVLPGSQYPK